MTCRRRGSKRAWTRAALRAGDVANESGHEPATAARKILAVHFGRSGNTSAHVSATRTAHSTALARTCNDATKCYELFRPVRADGETLRLYEHIPSAHITSACPLLCHCTCYPEGPAALCIPQVHGCGVLQLRNSIDSLSAVSAPGSGCVMYRVCPMRAHGRLS